MTAYNIIQKHPEWLELMVCGATPKKDIQRVAKRHIEEMEGKQNFSKLISDDIEELLKARYSILKSPLREEIENFDGIEFDGVIIKPDYSNIARKEHLAEVCAIFVKAIITELSGKAICTAAQVEEWRERYAVKLEGLKGKDEKEKKRYCNVPDCVKSIVNDQAKKIYAGLAKYGYIDCAESTFLWYFGNKTRREAKQPQKIKWITEDQKDGVKIFAFIWKCLYRFAETGDIEKETDVSWQIIDKYFDVPQAWLSKTLREEARQAINSKKRNDEISRIKEIFSDITKEVNKKAEDFNRERVRLEIQENRRRKNDPDPKERSKYIPDLDVL